jgi:hypothetical protein
MSNGNAATVIVVVIDQVDLEARHDERTGNFSRPGWLLP